MKKLLPLIISVVLIMACMSISSVDVISNEIAASETKMMHTNETETVIEDKEENQHKQDIQDKTKRISENKKTISAESTLKTIDETIEDEKQKEIEKKKRSLQKRARIAVEKVWDGNLTDDASWDSYNRAYELMDKLGDGRLKTVLKRKLRDAYEALILQDAAKEEEDTVIRSESVSATPTTGVDIDLSECPVQDNFVSMIPIENNERLNDLTPEELAAYYAYKSSFTEAMVLPMEDVIVYSGNMTVKQYNVLCSVMVDELFPYQEPSNYFYYYDKNSDGITDIVCNPAELADCYSVNQAYKETVQNIAREIVNSSMDERTAFYTISDWIMSHASYSLNAGDARYILDKGLGNCSSYSCLLRDMCNAVGIDCALESGYGNGAYGWGIHQWNKVKINNQWFHSDLSWCDFDTTYFQEYRLSGNLWNDHVIDGRFA